MNLEVFDKVCSDFLVGILEKREKDFFLRKREKFR